MKIIKLFFMIGLLFLLIGTNVRAFNQWTSEEPWGITGYPRNLAYSELTTETVEVIFNVASPVDPIEKPEAELRWFDPDGNEVSDGGTGFTWTHKYIDGIKVGHYASMQIAGWDRAEGLWQVTGDYRTVAFRIVRTADLTVSPGSLWDLEIVESFASPGPAPLGLTYDGSNLWNIADYIYRLEPSGTIDHEGALPYSGAAALDFDGTHFWNLDNQNNKIYKWDILDGLAKTVVDSIPSPASIPADLAYDGSYLWATSAFTDTIYKLDGAGAVEQEFSSPGSLPTGLAFDGTYLWNADAFSEKIYKMDLSEDIFSFPYSYPTDMAADGTYLWVANDSSPNRRIYKINSSGAVVSSFPAPDSTNGGVGGLTFDGTHLWHSNHKTDKIYKLDPSSGNVISSFDSPYTGPIGLAFDGTYLWCSDMLNRTIYKLNTSGTVITSFSTPGFNPKGLAFDGTYLLHADAGSNRIYKLTTTGAVVESFPSPGPGGFRKSMGLAFDGVKLWLSDDYDDTLYELIIQAPVIASFDSPGSYPYGLTFDGTYLWHADMDEGLIYKMDLSGAVLEEFSSPGDDPAGLTYEGGNLWNADINAALIYKMDEFGTVISSLASPGSNPSGLAFDGTYWWNADAVQGTIYQLDIYDALVATPFDPPIDAQGSNPAGIAFDGLYLWHSNHRGSGEMGEVHKLSTAGDPILLAHIPDVYEPGAVGYDGKYLWFTDIRNDRLYKGSTEASIRDIFALPGFMPSDMAFNDDDFWVADEANDMIYRLKIPGRIGVGASMSRTFTITSAGPIDLVVGTIGVLGADAAEFSLENDTCSGQTMSRDQTCTFQVVFSPDSEGDKEAEIGIPTNSEIISTWPIALSGTGILICRCDFEPDGGDGDVDGADLAEFLSDQRSMSVAEFAAEYGKTDCP